MIQKIRTGLPHVRMKDVAAHAKLSPMSVSRALRTPDQVTKETLLRVQQAVKDLAYVPNRLAGGLKAPGRTQLAAAIVPSVRDSLFAATLQGMTETLRVKGINLMLGGSGYALKDEASLIAAFLAHRPCGLVLHNTKHSPLARQLLRNAGISIVETGDLTSRPVDLVVSYSNFAAAKAMTEYLLRRGYERIAFVGPIAAHSERAKERQRGYKAALEDAGLIVDNALIFETQGSYENGAKALADLVKLKPKVDAIFFAGDVLVIGAMLESLRRGWDIPQQVAIAGFDDWEISRQFATSITTLQIPRYEIGRIAAELLLRRLDGDDSAIPPIDVGFRIVEGTSA